MLAQWQAAKCHYQSHLFVENPHYDSMINKDTKAWQRYAEHILIASERIEQFRVKYA